MVNTLNINTLSQRSIFYDDPIYNPTPAQFYSLCIARVTPVVQTSTRPLIKGLTRGTSLSYSDGINHHSVV